MCNAWNHPSGCTCGFGGEGHLGRRGSSTYFNGVGSGNYSWVPPIVDSYESYVNPNASCPVCGAIVFYYKSPDGGSVFFDELGPPWPKHPCTDRSSRPRAISREAADRIRKVQRRYAWQSEGWEPFFISAVIEVDCYFLKLLGKHKGSQLTLYIKRIVHPHSGLKNPIEPACLVSLRQRRDGNHDISIVTTENRVIQTQAYDSSLKAKTKKVDNRMNDLSESKIGSVLDNVTIENEAEIKAETRVYTLDRVLEAALVHRHVLEDLVTADQLFKLVVEAYREDQLIVRVSGDLLASTKKALNVDKKSGHTTLLGQLHQMLLRK